MKSLKRLFGKPKIEPEAVEEVSVVEVKEAGKADKRVGIEPIYIKSMELNSLDDVEEVADELRAGNIMILDISTLMNQDPNDLKRAIDQLKGLCHGIGGDVGRLSDTKVIATPKFVNIQFKKASV